jgi:hypothetical protein
MESMNHLRDVRRNQEFDQVINQQRRKVEVGILFQCPKVNQKALNRYIIDKSIKNRKTESKLSFYINSNNEKKHGFSKYKTYDENDQEDTIANENVSNEAIAVTK